MTQTRYFSLELLWFGEFWQETVCPGVCDLQGGSLRGDGGGGASVAMMKIGAKYCLIINRDRRAERFDVSCL